MRPSHLRVVAGPDRGQTFHIPRSMRMVLGRGTKASARLTDTKVSRLHCALAAQGDRLFVADLNSRSGILVNGQKVTRAELRTGDLLQLGSTQLRVQADEGGLVRTRLPRLSPERMHKLQGQTLSHYALGDVICGGSTGLLFRGYDFKHDRPVAFKVLWPHFSKAREDVRRFMRAMKSTLRLRHPNLVALYGAGKTGSYCWMALEFVEGVPLTQVLAQLPRDKGLDWKKALCIAIYVARGLEFAHAHRMVHRNVCPENVLVGARPELTKVSDLMLAKALDDKKAGEDSSSGGLLADVSYLAPEMLAGSTVDERCDLYSLGAITYALLTGAPPREDAEDDDSVARIRDQRAAPADFTDTIMRLLAKDPRNRYPDATTVLHELKQIAKVHSVVL